PLLPEIDSEQVGRGDTVFQQGPQEEAATGAYIKNQFVVQRKEGVTFHEIQEQSFIALILKNACIVIEVVASPGEAGGVPAFNLLSLGCHCRNAVDSGHAEKILGAIDNCLASWPSSP